MSNAWFLCVFNLDLYKIDVCFMFGGCCNIYDMSLRVTIFVIAVYDLNLQDLPWWFDYQDFLTMAPNMQSKETGKTGKN